MSTTDRSAAAQHGHAPSSTPTGSDRGHPVGALGSVHHAVSGATRSVQRAAGRVAAPALRLSIATLMLWFGIPKLVPGLSPAEDIAVRTVEAITHGLVTGDSARIGVGALEVLLGTALAVGRWMPAVLLLVLGHLACTLLPLVLFPAETWSRPFVGTLEGQYIIKNVVIVAAVVALAAHRGERPPRALTAVRDVSG